MPTPVTVNVGCLCRSTYLCFLPRGSTALHGASHTASMFKTNIWFADPVELGSSHGHCGCVGGETCLAHCGEDKRSSWMQATALVRRAALSEHTARELSAGAGPLYSTTGAGAASTTGAGDGYLPTGADAARLMDGRLVTDSMVPKPPA